MALGKIETELENLLEKIENWLGNRLEKWLGRWGDRMINKYGRKMRGKKGYIYEFFKRYLKRTEFLTWIDMSENCINEGV